MQIADWHKRYLEQAQWTKSLRHYILDELPIQSDWVCCELGCGTGAILNEVSSLLNRIIGLDSDLEALTFLRETRACPVNADAHQPPFQPNSFDFLFCHYFLLWIADPMAILKVARSLLKPGGFLGLFAEPDYASRQTFPEGLNKLASLQNQSLAAQGANVKIGRQLGQLLKISGFSLLEYGTMKESEEFSQPLSKSEKNVLRADWEFLNLRHETEITAAELELLLEVEVERWYVPTYYALARLN